MAEKLLSRLDFERAYGPKKTAFYDLLKTGALKGVKVGRGTYVRSEDAEAWAKSLPDYRPANER